MKSCTFIGHGECHDGIIPKLLQTVEQLITQRSFDTFYVGTHGNFDRFAYHVLCQLENQYNIKVNVVLAYLTNNHNDFYNSNKTIFPSILENTPPRYAIVKRNNYMLDKRKIHCLLFHFLLSYQ